MANLHSIDIIESELGRGYAVSGDVVIVDYTILAVTPADYENAQRFIATAKDYIKQGWIPQGGASTDGKTIIQAFIKQDGPPNP